MCWDAWDWIQQVSDEHPGAEGKLICRLDRWFDLLIDRLLVVVVVVVVVQTYGTSPFEMSNIATLVRWAGKLFTFATVTGLHGST